MPSRPGQGLYRHVASYYAGAKAGTITEETPLDPNVRRRIYYARAKPASEAILMVASALLRGIEVEGM